MDRATNGRRAPRRDAEERSCFGHNNLLATSKMSLSQCDFCVPKCLVPCSHMWQHSAVLHAAKLFKCPLCVSPAALFVSFQALRMHVDTRHKKLITEYVVSDNNFANDMTCLLCERRFLAADPRHVLHEHLHKEHHVSELSERLLAIKCRLCSANDQFVFESVEELRQHVKEGVHQLAPMEVEEGEIEEEHVEREEGEVDVEEGEIEEDSDSEIVCDGQNGLKKRMSAMSKDDLISLREVLLKRINNITGTQTHLRASKRFDSKGDHVDDEVILVEDLNKVEKKKKTMKRETQEVRNEREAPGEPMRTKIDEVVKRFKDTRYERCVKNDAKNNDLNLCNDEMVSKGGKDREEHRLVSMTKGIMRLIDLVNANRRRADSIRRYHNLSNDEGDKENKLENNINRQEQGENSENRARKVEDNSNCYDKNDGQSNDDEDLVILKQNVFSPPFQPNKRKNGGASDETCVFCNSLHVSSKFMVNHMERKHLRLLFDCRLCLKTTLTETSMIQHITAKHNQSWQSVENQMRIPEDLRVITCKICSKKWFAQSAKDIFEKELRKHAKEHGRRDEVKELFQLACRLCFVTFELNNDLEEHSWNRHIWLHTKRPDSSRNEVITEPQSRRSRSLVKNYRQHRESSSSSRSRSPRQDSTSSASAIAHRNDSGSTSIVKSPSHSSSSSVLSIGSTSSTKEIPPSKCLCRFCSRLIDKSQYTNHLHSEHRKQMFECKLCKKTFADRTGVLAHCHNRHPGQRASALIQLPEDLWAFECLVCDEEINLCGLPFEKAVNLHFARRHRELAKPLIHVHARCRFCGPRAPIDSHVRAEQMRVHQRRCHDVQR